MKSRTCATSLEMMSYLTSSVATIRHSSSWDESRSECSVCTSDGIIEKTSLAEHVGSQKTVRETHLLNYISSLLEASKADFTVLESLQRTGKHPPVESNAAWHELVATFYQAGMYDVTSPVILALRRGEPPIDMDMSTKAKILNDKSYKVFIDAVVDACRSNRAVSLGVTKCAINEEQDIESPRWITTTLTVWFDTADFTSRMDAWGKMRKIVDDYTEPLRTGDDMSRMRDIDSRFFIGLGYHNV